VIYCNNFRNGSGSAQTLAIPTPFVNAVWFRTGQAPPITLYAAASAKAAGIIVALAAGGGTVTSQNTINTWSIGQCGGAIDTVSFNSGVGSANSGYIILDGV
jgi:hypothetical protein